MFSDRNNHNVEEVTLLLSPSVEEEDEEVESNEKNDVAEPAEPSTTSNNPNDNAFVKKLLGIVDLHILQPGAVNWAYVSSSREVWLFGDTL